MRNVNINVEFGRDGSWALFIIFCYFCLNLWAETDVRPCSNKESNVTVLEKILMNER